jgi:uncharacterized membrane protein YhdT
MHTKKTRKIKTIKRRKKEERGVNLFFHWHSLLCLAQPTLFGTAYFVWHSLLCLAQPTLFGTAYFICFRQDTERCVATSFFFFDKEAVSSQNESSEKFETR